MKKFLFGLVLVTSISSFADELPTNFGEFSLFCQTWTSQNSESKTEAFDKFSISEENDDGIRYVSFKNSKEAFPCVEEANGLTCEGEAYQVLDYQLLEDTTEDQKFKAIVQLNYNNLGSNYIHGTGIVPKMKWYHLTKKVELNCAWE